MTNEEYHGHEAVSKSDLDAARQSGRHFFDKKFGPPQHSTAAFDLGTAFHAAALPGEEFDQVAIRMPEGLKKTTKEGKADPEGSGEVSEAASTGSRNGRTRLDGGPDHRRFWSQLK